MNASQSFQSFPAARFIKEIGRGKKGARSLTRDDAFELYKAMLEGRVSDLEMGALVLAMRIKGESVEEIAGFFDAAHQSLARLPAPVGEYAPVVIPSYNGSRNMPNLTPLLALLLARQGVPVLIHGVTTDPGRVTTAEILQEAGIGFCHDAPEVMQRFDQRQPAFIPVEALAPALARLLALRRVLGVRNSTHTLIKMVQPFDGPALRITPYTHPDFLDVLGTYFTEWTSLELGDVFLMRGTEGEAVANARRAQQIEWFHDRQRTVLVPKQEPTDVVPVLPATSDALTTAQWIVQALDGEQPVPPSISQQVQQCLNVARDLQAKRVFQGSAGQA